MFTFLSLFLFSVDTTTWYNLRRQRDGGIQKGERREFTCRTSRYIVRVEVGEPGLEETAHHLRLSPSRPTILWNQCCKIYDTDATKKHIVDVTIVVRWILS